MGAAAIVGNCHWVTGPTASPSMLCFAEPFFQIRRDPFQANRAPSRASSHSSFNSQTQPEKTSQPNCMTSNTTLGAHWNDFPGGIRPVRVKQCVSQYLRVTSKLMISSWPFEGANQLTITPTGHDSPMALRPYLFHFWNRWPTAIKRCPGPNVSSHPGSPTCQPSACQPSACQPSACQPSACVRTCLARERKDMRYPHISTNSQSSL